ncbi:nucleotidyltransferase family protein [Paenibacillus tepidiphilus]|uniref:nucleotidyltransferase family protein n=1 Tax=Paenibacillus tepidiphilus TaxID=2608683 RepID=UPI00193D6E0F|nr:nucleotidyltransferase family protein [Paenibacillus tepidiphilus]
MTILRIHNEEDLLQAVREDEWMMAILTAAAKLQLPDWWICAGFVRSKVWDVQHGFAERTPLPDIDVIYFDPGNIREETEKHWEARLRAAAPAFPWSVKNQARMHTVNNVAPYTSSTDGMAHFPETATALGLSLDSEGQVMLAAPHGVKDCMELRISATPFFQASRELQPVYEARVAKKNWPAIWPLLQVIHTDGYL